MRRKLILLLFVLFTCFITSNVSAEELEACSVTELAKLRQTAANIKVSYVPGVTENEITDGSGETATTQTRYIDVKIFNVTSGMTVNLEVTGDDINSASKTLDYTNKGSDGAITIRQSYLDSITNYLITITSSDGNCYGDTLRTFKLTLPKFNSYSELRACEDVPEFYLCQEYITFNIDGSTFYDSVDSYKEKLSNSESDPTVVDTITSTTLNNVSKYKYFIVGGIVALGVVATIVIIKRKRVHQ